MCVRECIVIMCMCEDFELLHVHVAAPRTVSNLSKVSMKCGCD